MPEEEAQTPENTEGNKTNGTKDEIVEQGCEALFKRNHISSLPFERVVPEREILKLFAPHFGCETEALEEEEEARSKLW